MKKFVLMAITMMIILACEAGVDINPTCILKHTGLVTRLQSSSGTVETAAANLSWTWVYGMPASSGVIIERSLGGQYDSIDYVFPIESLMTFTDLSDTLSADMALSYRLSLVTGTAVEYFDTVDFVLPPGQQIYSPDTEHIAFPNDTFLITFKKIAEYDTTILELYRTGFYIPESLIVRPIDEIYNLIGSMVWSDTIADTLLQLPADSLLIDKNRVFVLKITSSKNPTLGYITDTSIGLVIFRRY